MKRFHAHRIARTLLLLIIVTTVLAHSFAPVAAIAQTRRTRSSSSAQRRASTTNGNAANEARAAAASHVAEQIKNLSRFLYVYGRITNGFDVAATAAAQRQTTPELDAQLERNKATVRESLKNVREGLDKLELDFRTTPDLQRYYTMLQGVAAAAADAEDKAAANQYDQAGRSLLAVVNQLTNVLLEMR